MDQTCFGRSGGLAPISFPLFHGVRGRSFERHSSFSDMVVLLGYREPGACAAARAPPQKACQLSEACGRTRVIARARSAGFVQGFGRRPIEMERLATRPSSE